MDRGRGCKRFDDVQSTRIGEIIGILQRTFLLLISNSTGGAAAYCRVLVASPLMDEALVRRDAVDNIAMRE